MADETRILADYVAELTFDAIPPEVVGRAKLLMLDFLGSAVRARVETESTPSILASVEMLGLAGAGPCSVMADKARYAAPVAALLNGALGHSLDFDDTHAASSLHPSAPVVPAALAVGEMVGASGRDVLAAVIAGYEVCCRLGLALDPTAHYARGFHPTATAGTFGAASAAAKLFGLGPERVAAAFGVAASQAAGSLQFLANGAWNKRFQVGAAAMNGVIAATLARNGFRGATEAIEGRHGFLTSYSDRPRPELAVTGLGSDYETMRIAVKPYPSCRYTHAALDALIALRREHGFTGEDVVAVEIGLHRNGITLTAAPEAAKRRPQNVVEGQFSMAFTAAVALNQGSFGWDDYRLIGEPAIESLADKVHVQRDLDLEEGRPHPFGGRVRIETRDGVLEKTVLDPSGEPESFPDLDASRAKFFTLARPVLGERARQFADAVLSLDRYNRIGDALASARP